MTAAAALKAEDSAPVRLAGATRGEIIRTLVGIGTPERELNMRASQLWHWIYHRGAREFSAMRNIARPVLEKLAERCTLARPEIAAEQVSADGTRKWLLRMPPAHRFDKGAEIECVYIPESDAPSTARSATPARCRWCAT
jgi:23S rRNA (adenine2503-C2)-methyltransferase